MLLKLMTSGHGMPHSLENIQSCNTTHDKALTAFFNIILFNKTSDMTKKSQLALCNALLLAGFLLTLITSAALLMVHGYTPWLMWTHVGVGAVFIGMAYWHFMLNLGPKQWKAYPKKSPAVKIAFILLLLTALSAIAAFIRGFIPPFNPRLQIIHGWIGGIFLVICLLHFFKHHKYYESTRK